MGCGNSSRIDVVQPSVQELQNGWGAKTQASNDPSQKATASTIWDGARWSKGTLDSEEKLEDELSGGNSPGKSPERLPSSREKNNRQNTDPVPPRRNRSDKDRYRTYVQRHSSQRISDYTWDEGEMGGILTDKRIHHKGGVGVYGMCCSHGKAESERERQESSDILEELMMQGIIKSQSTTFRNGEADVKGEALEKQLKKPPAKLEKLKIEKKEVNVVTMEHIKNSAEERRKTKEEQMKERLQNVRLFPAIAHQNIADLNEEDYSTSEGQEGTNIVQPLSFDLETETLEKKEIAVEIVNSNLEHFGDVESDTTYNNLLNEAF